MLSPTLFNIIIDSLLRNLELSGQGLSLYGLDVGASAHADDIRAASNCITSAEQQGQCITAFCAANHLRLNPSKTEAVTFSKGRPPLSSINIAEQSVTTQQGALCLGTWWKHDLSPCRSIQENISKARRAFFALGSVGAFHGKLNPLTGRSLYESFVISILLYGCETWILSRPLVTELEKFQSEMGRRILTLSRFHSDLAPIVGLRLPSIKARVLIRKISFLAKLLPSDGNELSARVFRTLATDSVYNISLVQQCRWLESELGIDSVLSKCLASPDLSASIVRSSRPDIINRDWSISIEKAMAHSSLNHITCSDVVSSNWCRVWDTALDHGVKGTRLVQLLFRSLCRPTFGDRLCPHCSSAIPIDQSYFEHLCHCHINFNLDSLSSVLEGDSNNLFRLASSLPYNSHSV